MKSIFRIAWTYLFIFCSYAADQPYFFFPRETLLAHLKDYNEQEKEWIERDLEVVRSICFSNKEASDGAPLYIASAGAPGARKTTILERFLEKHPLQSQLIYLDADQRALKFMTHTYYSLGLSAVTIAKQMDYSLVIQQAYDKWTGGANYIAYTLLEEAFLAQRSIAQGTTSTGERVPRFLSAIKKAGYQIVLLLCFCEDDFRYKSIQYRNEKQRFYQSTPEHAVIKGKLFPQRMSAYFTYGDTLYLYWSDDLFTPERLAAVLECGELNVLDPQAFHRCVQKYESDRAILHAEGQPFPPWEELINMYRNRFHN